MFLLLFTRNTFSLLPLFLMIITCSAKAEVKTEDDYLNVLDSAHSEISKRLFMISNRMDSFFGSTRGDDYASGTRLRIYWDHYKKESYPYSSKLTLRLKLDLPDLQNKIKFKFNWSQKKENVPKAAENSNQSNLKLGPKIEQERLWRLSMDSGLNVEIPIDPFIRTRLFKTYFFGKWELLPAQEFFYYLREKLGETTTLNLDHPIRENILLRIENAATWYDNSDELATIHGPSLFQEITDKRAISYNLKAIGTNRPTFYIKDYYASVTYRQDLHRQWIYGEITPQINWPKEKKFERVLSILFRLETMFGAN